MAEAEKQAPRQRPGCFRRLIGIIFWLSFGFLLGWVINDAEQNDFNAKKTYESTCKHAGSLFERIKALIPESAPDKPDEEDTSDEPVDSDLTEPVKPKPTPVKPRVKQPTSELDRLLAKGDSVADEGQKLFDKAKSISNASKSTGLYKQALPRYEEAMSIYQKAEKLSPGNARIQKKITNAGTQIYWCKKLQRMQ